MKNFKLILAAAIMFVVGNAFTQAPKDKEDANWYTPIDPNLLASDAARNEFESYDPSSAQEIEPSCDPGTVHVCAAQFLDPEEAPNQVTTKE